MLIIIDKRLPVEAKQSLAKYGEVLKFASSGITYEAISGHPDIFLCQTPAGLVVAPNTPAEYLAIFTSRKIPFTLGRRPIGNVYPETALYNAVATGKYLIHNLNITDTILAALTTSLNTSNITLSAINTNQGYTRCNLISLDETHFITTDKGIEKALLAKDLDVHFISPAGVLLPGFDHGFFGGCCGVWDKTLFIAGTLDHFPQGGKVLEIVTGIGMKIIELYDGPLFDGGGIFFLPC